MMRCGWQRHLLVGMIVLVFLATGVVQGALYNTVSRVVSPQKSSGYPGDVSCVPTPENVTIVVEVTRIRCLTGQRDDPTIYLDISIEGESAMWWEPTFMGRDVIPEWAVAARDVPYNCTSPVDIEIQLWRKYLLGSDEPCDISGGTSGSSYQLSLQYDVKRGEWSGDDFLRDENGYGHGSGYEDGDYFENDYEIWFDIFQFTGDEYYDGYDRLTWYEKQNVYGCNPVDSSDNLDFDDDGVPNWWEDKYGYNPLQWDDHMNLDPDKDGLTNYEEWETSDWLSDPFTQDIFIEVDYMQGKRVWSDPYVFPVDSQYLICDAFARHDITLHIDDGRLGGGGDLIPFDEGMDGSELQAARLKYFLKGDPQNWRLSVFHYAIICCQMEWSGRPAGGRMFYTDSHVIGGQYVKNWAPLFVVQGSDYATGFASVFMHELGHTLGLNRFEGIDNENSRFPWNEEYWLWGPYHSCMNYRYVYKLVDYSNGDDEDYDQNDWEVIDLTRFTRSGW